MIQVLGMIQVLALLLPVHHIKAIPASASDVESLR
jgi:hypothetical protein